MSRVSSGTARPDNVTLAAFAGVILLGGANSVAIRFSNVELPPFSGAAARFAAAALLMFAGMLFLRLPFPKGRALAGIVAFGVLNFGLSYALIYWGLLEVQAGLAQVVIAIAPLATFFLALAHRQESWQVRPIVGSLLAIAGIAVVFGEQVSAAVPLLPLLAIVATAICIAEATVLVKGFPPVHIVTLNAVAMAVGTVFLTALALVAGERATLPTRLETGAGPPQGRPTRSCSRRSSPLRSASGSRTRRSPGRSSSAARSSCSACTSARWQLHVRAR